MTIATRVHIRWMIRRDLPEVVAIEQEAFVEPWEELDFITELRKRNVIGMVAEHSDGRIIGYMIYELHKKHLFVLKIAVHEDYRRQRVGTALLDKLKSKLSSQRRHYIEMMVSERNTGGHIWLRDNQFRCVEVNREAYSDDVDAAGYLFRFVKGEA